MVRSMSKQADIVLWTEGDPLEPAKAGNVIISEYKARVETSRRDNAERSRIYPRP